MSVKIGSNITSLSAQRRLGEASDSLSRIYERLSSGQRINRVSDDAAGLAIADELSSRGRVYAQAIRNGNDGISLLNIADSAISALTSIVVRIRELSEQSANGTYSHNQRAALDAEAQQLSKEFSRISQTTSFNGIKIFDGSAGSGVRIQLGYGISDSISASLGGAIGTGELTNHSTYQAESYSSEDIDLGDVNGDGILDLVTAGYENSTNGYVSLRLGNGDGSFGIATTYTTESRASYAVNLVDLNSDGMLDLVTGGENDSLVDSVTVRLGNGSGTFGEARSFSTSARRSFDLAFGDLNGDGNLDLVTAGLALTANGSASVLLGRGDGTFGPATAYETESTTSNAISLADLNGDGILDLVTAGLNDGNDGYANVRLGSGDGSFGSVATYATEGRRSFDLALGDINLDGITDLVTSGYDDSNNGFATVRLGTGTGTFGSAVSYSAESRRSYALSLADMNGDGFLDLVTAGTTDALGSDTTIRLGQGNGTFGTATSYTSASRAIFALSVGDLNGDGVLDIAGTGYLPSAPDYEGKVIIQLGNSREGLGGLLSFSLKTVSDSKAAMSLMDQTLNNLSKQRGVTGASQSRLNIAISNLASTNENTKMAEVRIRDADIAAESANLIRTQILQQAAASVLTQANQIPSLALMLLQ